MVDLRFLFTYDLWANRRWLSWLEERVFPEPESPIFRHILSAQAAWAERCEGRSPTALPEVELREEELLLLNRRWISLVQDNSIEHVVSYRRTTGEALQLTFGAIALHVANHGTYHRGELRGLRRSAGDNSFPETDLILYALETQNGAGR